VTDPALGMDAKPCSNSGVINCSVNTVQKMLEHFFGSVQDREPQYQDQGTLYAIDQDSSLNTGLADYGYLFVPDACQDKDKLCKFHVHFHGCTESNARWEDSLVRKYGFLEYSVPNEMIVYFPQNNDTQLIFDMPYCWVSMLATT